MHGDNKSLRDRCRYFGDGDIGHDAELWLNCRVETAR
jgi:hypothetical protein